MKKTVLAGVAVIGCLFIIGISYAWYTRQERVAESDTLTVMTPYKLSLMNPSETDVLQLSIGSLLLDETKQIVFCVENGIEQENVELNYEIEMIYTNNLALEYKIYELDTAADENNPYIVAEDIISVDGELQARRTYWDTKTGVALTGADISDRRHDEAALNGDEVNSGTYVLYTEDSSGDSFQLSSSENSVNAHFFVMEIKWKDGITGYEDYEKETDMIFLVVRALQPKPEKS